MNAHPAIWLFLLILSSQLSAQTNISATLQHQSLQRQYTVHLPPGFDDAAPTPVLLTLHGGGGTALSVQGFTRMNQVSNQKGFLAVYPQGFTETLSGFSWADGRGAGADEDGIDDVGFIDKLIDTLAADYNIDTRRVYVCGFSNGGFMSQRLACVLPERFAAVGGLGCSMDTSLFANCDPSRPVPMIYVSGTADPFVPFEGGEMLGDVTPIVPVDSAVQFWVDHNGCRTAQPVVAIRDSVTDDNSTAQRFDFTDCDRGAEVRFFKLIGAGHTWAGVELPMQELILGETNEDIQASFELWKFFRQFSLDASTSTGERGLTKAAIRIFPNPASDRLTIRSDQAVHSVYVFDPMGRLVGRLIEADVNPVMPLGNLAPGLYWVKVQLKSGAWRTKKFIKNGNPP